MARLFSINSRDLFEPIPEQFSIQFSEYFPLPNKQKVLEVEEILQNKDFKINLICFCKHGHEYLDIKRIKTFGGVDLSYFIKTCLKKLFSNELSTQISFTGKAFKKHSDPKMALIKLQLFQMLEGTDNRYYSDDIVQKSVILSVCVCVCVIELLCNVVHHIITKTIF